MDVGGCWDGHLKVRIWLVERLVRMLAPLLVLVVIVVVGGSVDDSEEDDDWMLAEVHTCTTPSKYSLSV